MRILSLVCSGLLLVLSSGMSGTPEAPKQAPPPARSTDGVARPVEGQLAAYNAHDLERFLDYYAADARVHLVGRDSTSVVRGKDAMRRAYAFLKSAPAGFRAEIVSRTVTGHYVIDHERILKPARPDEDALVIYEVLDSLIYRVWLLPSP